MWELGVREVLDSRNINRKKCSGDNEGSGAYKGYDFCGLGGELVCKLLVISDYVGDIDIAVVFLDKGILPQLVSVAV